MRGLHDPTGRARFGTAITSPRCICAVLGCICLETAPTAGFAKSDPNH